MASRAALMGRAKVHSVETRPALGAAEDWEAPPAPTMLQRLNATAHTTERCLMLNKNATFIFLKSDSAKFKGMKLAPLADTLLAAVPQLWSTLREVVIIVHGQTEQTRCALPQPPLIAQHAARPPPFVCAPAVRHICDPVSGVPRSQTAHAPCARALLVSAQICTR